MSVSTKKAKSGTTVSSLGLHGSIGAFGTFPSPLALMDICTLTRSGLRTALRALLSPSTHGLRVRMSISVTVIALCLFVESFLT